MKYMVADSDKEISSVVSAKFLFLLLKTFYNPWYFNSINKSAADWLWHIFLYY